MPRIPTLRRLYIIQHQTSPKLHSLKKIKKIGGVILSPQIKACLQDYWGRLKSGEMKRYK